MEPRVDKDIIIKTNPQYQGYDANNKCHVFSYHIDIENLTSETVQLLSRYWNISDGLDFTKEVKGDGVIGQQPTLTSGERYDYGSQCYCVSEITCMKGYYIFQNIESGELIKALVPSMTFVIPNKSN